jgi:hypothetical protein
LYHPLRSILYSPSAHRLLFLFFSFGFFRPYSSSYIVCANVVNVPLSRRFGEQLTLLCCTLYYFTRHFDSLFDVFFCCAKRSSARRRRRRPSSSIHFSQWEVASFGSFEPRFLIDESLLFPSTFCYWPSYWSTRAGQYWNDFVL